MRSLARLHQKQEVSPWRIQQRSEAAWQLTENTAPLGQNSMQDKTWAWKLKVTVCPRGKSDANTGTTPAKINDAAWCWPLPLYVLIF